jgi:Pyruvate/2-oxoacid:ferredoxin oxidoreductase delta subunit
MGGALGDVDGFARSVGRRGGREKMPEEYISREAALKYIKSEQCRTCSDIGLCGNCAVLVAVKLLEKVPAADVAEVVHGEWLRADDDWNSLTTIQCSLCSEEWCFETDDDVSLLNYKYCPNCGAKMDGGNDDATD